VATRLLCRNTLHLRKIAQGVIDEGGEGVILRQKGSFYIPGRTPFLIKLKVTTYPHIIYSTNHKLDNVW
jgi:ATP-dependent DNA ligase